MVMTEKKDIKSYNLDELKQEFVQKLYGEFSTYREHLLCENPTDLIARHTRLRPFPHYMRYFWQNLHSLVMLRF